MSSQLFLHLACAHTCTCLAWKGWSRRTWQETHGKPNVKDHSRFEFQFQILFVLTHGNFLLNNKCQYFYQWVVLEVLGPFTDKETDKSLDSFIIWKINSGPVWAVGSCLCKKSLGLIMSNSWGPCFYVFMGKK